VLRSGDFVGQSEVEQDWVEVVVRPVEVMTWRLLALSGGSLCYWLVLRRLLAFLVFDLL